ncbi:MAG: hypothetical protein ACI9R3_003305 [Verrucomicrobiales bacterium]|jgi:hypothetical protein
MGSNPRQTLDDELPEIVIVGAAILCSISFIGILFWEFSWSQSDISLND